MGIDPLIGDVDTGRSIFRRDCARCHTLGRGDLRAPDLMNVHDRAMPMWLTHWLEDSEDMATWNMRAINLADQWGWVMPDTELSCQEIADVLAFIEEQSAIGPLQPAPPVSLSSAELDETTALYFNRCAGCHGTYRLGATGPDISQARSSALGTDTLGAVIRHGLPAGMPSWGDNGILSETEIARLAAFLQLPPPTAPALPLHDIVASWDLMVPVDARPTAPLHAWDWENFFAVVLRDPGEVALFDGDSHAEVTRIDAGFATHILRASSTGRLLYAVGRDGWVTLIDTWAAPPVAVAQVRGCHDSRSVESSKLAGYEERFLIQGCYWPPQYVVYDGATLEPLARVDVPLDAEGTGELLPEVRVASVIASPFAPLWVLTLKEAGYIGLVDYTQPGFPLVERIAAERTLHDGGWDHTRRWFLAAAPGANRVVAIDVLDQELDASFETGVRPHPGRGANWLDPTYGWVNGTVHVGENKLAVYGADPIGRPEHAWHVVREVPLDAAGSLFLKTHELSPWVLIDFTMASDPADSRRVCAYQKSTGTIERCFTVADRGRVTHFELNRDGTEVWVSVWDEEGELVVYDAVTLEEIDRITGLETPTGKFNVYNTAHDVY